MLSFGTPLLALAGLLAASGPVLLHLWNRRRFRTVTWGAMQFLQQALTRQRRAIHLRNVLLLIVRMVILVLIGLALAEPFVAGTGVRAWLLAVLALLMTLVGIVATAQAVMATSTASRRNWSVLAALCGICLLVGGVGTAVNSSLTTGSSRGHREPVHLLALLDNSRSMGVTVLDGTRLDQAKKKLQAFCENLPSGSRVSIIPLAGQEQAVADAAFSHASEIRQAIDDIKLVDAADQPAAALEHAVLIAQQTSEPQDKRVVVLTDLLSEEWSRLDWSTWRHHFPDLQLVSLGGEAVSNIWVEEIKPQDGFAGVSTDTHIQVRIRCEHLSKSRQIEARLSVDGIIVGSQTVELGAGQTREMEFVHRWEQAGELASPRWSAVKVDLSFDTPDADRLPADNSLTVLVPVVGEIPVVFVDAVGAAENVSRGIVGETYALRHLLAPRTTREESQRPLIHVVHVRPEEVTSDLLATARLVVVGGVESPGSLVDVLKEYVTQGGPLVLLAGGNFHPQLWTEQAWLDGEGILPAPLQAELLGQLPTAAGPLEPFFVDFSASPSRDLRIENEDPAALSAVFETTPFFQAVRADVPLARSSETEGRRIAFWQKQLATLREQRDDDKTKRASPIEPPVWWNWRNSLAPHLASLSAEELVQRERPEVEAVLTREGWPWIVSRRVGEGTVMLFTSGVTSDWNLLRSSPAMYVFHRTLYRLLSGTFPVRNVKTGKNLMLPQSAGVAQVWELSRPNGQRERLMLESFDGNRTALVPRRLLTSGLYAIFDVTPLTQEQDSSSPLTIPSDRVAHEQFGVQAPVNESLLVRTIPSEWQTGALQAGIHILTEDDPLRLETGNHRGEFLWRWSALAAMAGLLLEMGILARTQPVKGASA